MSFPTEDLKQWFIENKRAFPWRENPTPYRVWVSEVMLQQTLATVVVGFFERWMQRFPMLNDLAKSSDSEVVKMWEGLGYYSRARNLHNGAKYIVEHFDGTFPSDEKGLSQIKGIGSYTKGAILSFAFHKKAVAVDGNVLRVITRYYALEKCIDLPKTRKEIEGLVEKILPEKEPWIISEALIELGATVCQKKPKCDDCPLVDSCLGKKRAHLLPVRKEKVATTVLYRAVAMISCGEEFLVVKGEKGKVMGELFEFPFLEMKSQNIEEIQKRFEEKLGLKLKFKGVLKEQKHTFTRFRAHLFPLRFESQDKGESHYWEAEPKKLAFSSGHKRILDESITY